MKKEWTAPGKMPADKSLLPVELAGVEIAHVRTTADGGYRIYLDCGECHTPEVLKLMACRSALVTITVEAYK